MSVTAVPFPNGAAGDDWQTGWCDRCVNDHGFHQRPNQDGCEIWLRLVCFDVSKTSPVESITVGKDGRVYCAEWSPCLACGVHPDIKAPTPPTGGSHG